MIFVKQNTPPNASIVIPPPEAPWNNEGSGPLMTAFLYPRRIVQREKDENKIDLNADYAIVAWGWWGCGKEGLDRDEKECHGWPRVKVPAEWVIYKEKDSMRTIKKIVNTAYDPQSQENKSAWGLIKIKKGQ
jgi:hypothetical protein